MITVIAAVSKDGFIGKNGVIPWRLKSDMLNFRRITTGHPVVMGRKTWESLHRPLPDRRNIVVTRRDDFVATDADVVHSLEEALTLTAECEQVFIIGGGEIYRQALPLVERLLVTRVDTTVGDGDVRFPDIAPGLWNLISRAKGMRGENDECEFTVEDYSPNLRYIELANARKFSQLKVMREIRKAGHCPFCPENLSLYHGKPILWEGDHWMLTENQWPYSGTETHHLLISRTHAENIRELSEGSRKELFSTVEHLEVWGSFPGGGVCMRSGDPLFSGATVKHLHVQVIVPQRGAGPVRFYLGTGPR